MVSAVEFSAVAYAVEFRNAPISNPDFVRVLPPMGRLLLLLGGGFTGILLLLAMAAAILQTGILPRWLAWLGILAAVVLLFDVSYLTIFPLWGRVLIASVVMLARHEKNAAEKAATIAS
jgi:hypothetical protein